MTLAAITAITDRIVARSAKSRGQYLEQMARAADAGPGRAQMGCSNLAHVAAAMPAKTKIMLTQEAVPNLGIITAYNDMLSAHAPFESYPAMIKQAAEQVGATAQVAGGVPAMCDGVTQSQPGMELSLYSRDVIAMAAAIGLSHNCFDAVVYLGMCDKIVPGLVIAAARFGHLPAVFLPAGPMASGLPNDEKAKARQRFAAGEIGREDLLAAEMASYHAPGICTFYGTANTNQMLMEVMGLHLPGASHANPAQNIRNPLTVAGTQRVLSLVATGSQYTPVCQVLSERAFVNGVVGLHATGGSTNLAIHLIAMARAAGVILTWQDIADLSNVVPLISRVYPNGLKDINHFYAAGGLAFVVNECLNAGLMHNEVKTVAGDGLEHYAAEPVLNGESVKWQEGPTKSLDDEVLRTVSDPFQATGGLVRLSGNLGEAVMKVSAVKPEHKVIEAPARVFHDQDSVKVAFKAGELDRDVVCVVRFQGPRANGMPELHGLTPSLSVLQDRGYKVALVTDGRMSGASGKIPAAIHLSPEADGGGPIARLRDGDIVRIDANEGNLSVIDVDLDSRDVADAPTTEFAGVGRELFEVFRGQVGSATTGASIFT